MIFALTEQEETKSEIARTMYAKGLERRNGKPWTPRQVTAILATSVVISSDALIGAQ